MSPLKAAVYDLLRHLEKLLQEMCRVDELFGVPARQHALTMALENPLGRSFHLLDGFAKVGPLGLTPFLHCRGSVSARCPSFNIRLPSEV